MAEHTDQLAVPYKTVAVGALILGMTSLTTLVVVATVKDVDAL